MPPKARLRGLRVGWVAALPALAIWACQPPGVRPFPTELDQLTSAGDLTTYDATTAAYSQPAANLTPTDLKRHLAGDRTFEAQFVSAPAPLNPGLGPVFNNNSCFACHKGDAGGKPPDDGGTSATILFRVSLPTGQDAHGGPAPVPGFGLQIQEQANFGLLPEAKVTTHYTAVPGAYADGTAYTLQQPNYALTSPYTPLPAGILLSPRLTPTMVGLGALEAVPAATILALADPSDQNGDGISGRANLVWDVKANATTLGRFGWKANTPTLEQQTAAAFQQDMGITTPFFPQEACAGQPQASAAPVGPDLDDAHLQDTVYYVRTLGAPARRNVADASVRAGADLFRSASCAGCHVPTLVTGDDPDIPELAHQVIHPYTDLLLHDMGPALADGRPDYLASASEWRTTPLWGLGLRQRVEGHQRLLHDGRANGPAEAILWHGGEAEAAKQAFVKMSADERAALLAFLNSL